MKLRSALLSLLLVCAFVASAWPARAEKGMTYVDLMKVRKTHGEVIAADGSWIAFEARPGRGDGEVVAHRARGGKEVRIERGQAPQLSRDGRWLAAKQLAPFAERMTAEEGEEPKPGAVLLRTDDGERWSFERVRATAFSDDGAWFAVHFLAPEEEEDDEDADDATEAETTGEASEGTAGEPEDETQEDEAEREAGTRLLLIRLADLERFEVEAVDAFAFDAGSAWLALARATGTGEENGLELRPLADPASATLVDAAPFVRFPRIAWAEDDPVLAYLRGLEEEPGTSTDLVLGVVEAGGSVEPSIFEAPEGWIYPEENELEFRGGAERVFVGLRPAEPEDDAQTDENAEAAEDGEDGVEAEDAAANFDPYDYETIFEDRGVDVWHWDDPRIKTHEKASWEDRQEHLYRAVVHRDGGELVRLADATLPDVAVPENAEVALGTTDEPWLELMTWDGFYRDAHLVDLRTGERTLVVEKTQDAVSLSPDGRYVAYYRPDGNGQWWLYDVADGTHRQLVAEGVPWADQDHDYPRTAPGYGIGGWATDGSSVLVYDEFDVWRFDTATAEGTALTGGRGRAESVRLRVVDLDPDQEGFEPDASLLLEGFDEEEKNSSFWRVPLEGGDLRLLREDEKFYRVIARAEDADTILYTEERYDEFPDLWVADLDFDRTRRLSEVNPQLEDFDLGEAELVEWSSADGTPLQGVLIKPAGYDPDERYPVLVYFYRFFSQRLHRFNDPQINHRPSLPIYAGDGYAVFLPDIRFDVGLPGYAATKCLVPGMKKIVEMGVADPDAIALHGHSWSGYQTAHVITQTDLFACAVAGAPVSNMTSAYGGIRYGSGLSRQFQYEKTQSRIGATLWQRRDLYVENSPLFYADRIDTPLLIMFGDEDEAVPWTQGIELYMAMRRLDKPCVFLQYRGEPHHPQKYGNKLDYSLRMKEFIDHFCKGAPAPDWWTEGVPYEGE